MPFTFAHPAIVLPLNRLSRGRLSMSALVIGSMIPDFEGFLLVTDVKTYSHTWHGMFWLDIPLGLALAFLFHNIVRNPLIDNLPLFFKRRFVGYKRLAWNRYFRQHFLVVLGSTLVGIFSHLLWDDFTHLTGFFVRHIPLLQKWFYIGGSPYPVYKLLQFGTSVIGMGFVLIGIGLMPAKGNVRVSSNAVYWIITFCVAAAFVACSFMLGLEIVDFSLLFITCMSGGLLGVVMASLLTREIRGSVLR